MQHRLVIIGSLYENVALVKEAKKRGIYTIVCDGYKNGHSKDLADKFYDIDIRDTDQVAEMCAAEKADGIIGSFSDLVFEKVTEIADKAGLKWYVPADGYGVPARIEAGQRLGLKGDRCCQGHR